MSGQSVERLMDVILQMRINLAHVSNTNRTRPAADGRELIRAGRREVIRAGREDGLTLSDPLESVYRVHGGGAHRWNIQ